MTNWCDDVDRDGPSKGWDDAMGSDWRIVLLRSEVPNHLLLMSNELTTLQPIGYSQVFSSCPYTRTRVHYATLPRAKRWHELDVWSEMSETR